MAQIVKELRVDVSQPNVFQAIVAKQHDSNSRFLKITLVDFGVKVEVPNTAKVTINANRPDGASESFKGEANNDGTITVPLAQWMLDIDGEVKCDVSVTNTEDNKRLTSTDFWLEVQKAANPNASIPLDPDGEILIIKPVTEINGNSKDTDYPSAKAVYDYGQNIVTDTQITATASGNAITIDSANAPLQNLKLFGKTTQNGTPTPDAPVPLVSVGDNGSFEVGVYGKSLFDIGTDFSEYFTTTGGNTISTNKGAISTLLGLSFKDNTIVVDKYITPPYAWLSKFIDLTPNTYYTVSAESAFGGARIYGADSNTLNAVGKDLVYISGTPQPTTFNSGNYKYYWISFYPAEVGKVLSKCQVELGTQATPYEPYKAKQSITFTDTLRGIGDIADEKDFARGVATQRFEKIDLGTLTWTIGQGTSLTYFSAFLPNYNFPTSMSNSVAPLLCSHYKVVAQRERSSPSICGSSGAVNQILITDTSYTSVSEFKSAMSGVYLIYKLETPIETPLTEQELNAYRHLMTNKGTTTILSECEDTEITYYVNKPNAQAIGSLHEQINKDYLKLQQAIISTGGSTL